MHNCGDDNIGCVQNEKSEKLIVFIKSVHFEANFCPFCGYQPERSKREDMNNEKINVKMECDSTYPVDPRLYS